MKLIISFFLFLISNFLFSQEIYQNNDVYFDNNIAYKFSNNEKLTGFLEFRDKKNIMSTKEEYNNGVLSKQFKYYKYSSLKKYIPFEEIIFKDGLKYSKTTFHSTEEKSSYTEFDDNGKKKYYEVYKNGKTVLTQNFKNGKLDGKSSCYDKKGNFQEHYYKEGKLIE